MNRRRPIIASIVAAGALSLSAGCGSTSPSSVAASSAGGRPTQAQMQLDAVHLSGCMRSHGVPAFPDPTDPHAFKSALDPSSALAQAPAFQPAFSACRHFLPNHGNPPSQDTVHTQAQIAAMLAFARCMRGHGFPGFPDPSSAGDLSHEMVAGAGIDLHQPAAVQAGDACVGVTHGLITTADVARFVSGH